MAKYTFVINEELKYFMKIICFLSEMKILWRRFSCFTEVIRFVYFLQNFPSRITIDADEVKYHPEHCKTVEYPSELIGWKWHF